MADTGIVCIREELLANGIPLEVVVPDPNIRHLIENAENIMPNGDRHTLKFPVRFLRTFMHHAVLHSEIRDFPEVAARNFPYYLSTTGIGRFLISNALTVEILAFSYARKLNKLLNNLFETHVASVDAHTLIFFMAPKQVYLDEPGAELGNLLHQGTIAAIPVLAGGSPGKVRRLEYKRNKHGEALCTAFQLSFQGISPWRRLLNALNLIKSYHQRRKFHYLAKTSSFTPLERHLLGKLDESQKILSHLQHDINNELSLVYTNLDILKTCDESLSGPEKKGVAEDAFQGARRMDRMLDSYVETLELYTRLQGRTHPVPQKSTAQILYQLAQDSRYASVSFDMLQKCKVRMADDRVRQVMVNLLNNAVRAAGSNDNPRVQVKERVSGGGKMYKLTVRDNGNGIPVHRQERIWQTYVSYAEGGTGIGLDVVRSNVEEVGGYAVLKKSEPGKGAVFEIGIPLFNVSKI